MDTDELQQYLTKTHREMLLEMAERLGIALPSNFSFPEIICRPLFSTASLVINPDGTYKIYVCALKNKKESLTEQDIASAEIGIAHETGHILHIEGNPAWHKKYDEERAVVRTFAPDICTPSFYRLEQLDDVTAEYLALQFIDERQGLEVFLKRHSTTGIVNLTGLYGGVAKAMRRIGSDRRMEVAGVLIKSDYDEVRKVPELEQEIFSETERYIAKHPKLFNPPYQLGFAEMRFNR